MKCMNRNKSKFFYALYTKSVPIVDEYGNTLGEMEVQHGDPIEHLGNISAARGETITRQFGEDVAYDKVLVLDNGNAPKIDEYSVLWVDTLPQLDAEGRLAVDENGKVITPYDYTVKKVARSLNYVSYAISKVIVSG